MKTNRFIFAALSIAAAVSCQKDGFVGQETLRETESAVLVTGEATRTSLNGNVVQWTDDDVVALFDNTNYKNEFNITDVNGAYASFYGEVTSGTTQVYAVYPYNLALGAEGSTLTVNIPEDQTSKVGSFAEEHNISVAKGTKTPGVEAIQSVTFKNVCSQLKFTIPSYVGDATSVTLSASSPIAGVATVDFSGDSPAVSISSEGSRSITMTGSYSAGSMFMFVLAPGTYNGCTVTVATEKANWTITKTSTFTLEPGRYKNLGVLELEQVTAAEASAAHTYNDDDVLTGTKVTVNLNIPTATQKYVTKLNLSVKNSAGEEVRKLSKDGLSATETLAADTKWPYLPQGKYTVSGSYTLADGTEKTISEVEFTSPAPTFEGTVKVTGTTSYSVYYNDGVTKNPDGANKHPAETISDISASCSAVANISSEILAKIPVNYSITLDGKELKNDTTTSTDVISVEEQSGQSWGTHSLKATFTFDGVAITDSRDCRITGLPYSAIPPTKSGAHAWTEDQRGGGAPVFEWKSDEVIFAATLGSGNTNIIGSPEFKIPSGETIPVDIDMEAHGNYRKAWIEYKYPITTKVHAGGATKTFTVNGDDLTYDLYEINDLSLTHDKSKIQIENTHLTEAKRLYVKSVSVSYR